MTQNDMVLLFLQEEGSITPLDAIREFGCLRLSARIAELRETHKIETVNETAKNRYGRKVTYARYFLRDDTTGVHETVHESVPREEPAENT